MRQNSRAARQKTTEHVCSEPRRSVTIRTASMHLRTGAWGKKSIAKLPDLSKCVEATLLTLPSPKGETPLQRVGRWGMVVLPGYKWSAICSWAELRPTFSIIILMKMGWSSSGRMTLVRSDSMVRPQRATLSLHSRKWSVNQSIR